MFVLLKLDMTNTLELHPAIKNNTFFHAIPYKYEENKWVYYILKRSCTIRQLSQVLEYYTLRGHKYSIEVVHALFPETSDNVTPINS